MLLTEMWLRKIIRTIPKNVAAGKSAHGILNWSKSCCFEIFFFILVLTVITDSEFAAYRVVECDWWSINGIQVLTDNFSADGMKDNLNFCTNCPKFRH